MSQKKKSTLRTLSPAEIPALDEDISTLYRVKLESNLYTNSSSQRFVNHQSVEMGRVATSANGSAANSLIITPVGSYEEVLIAFAQSRQSGVVASVVDVTRTAVTINAIAIGSAGALMSSVTTASMVIDYMLVGSNP